MTADTITAIKKALEGVTIEKWGVRPDTLDNRVWEVYPPRNGPPENGVWSELFVCADQYGKKNEAKSHARYLKSVNPVAISKLLSTLESLQRENEELRDEIDSAACLLETLSEGKPSDDVDAIMMRVMAKRNRAALSSTGDTHGN